MAAELARDIDRPDQVSADWKCKDGDALQGQLDSVTASLPGAKAQQDWDDKNRQHLAARADFERSF